MALSVALPLSGLETETFSSFSAFELLGLSHSSPSLSTSSDSCSIGSLGSLKSDSLASVSVPTSPQATEKKICLVTPVVEPEVEVKVMYRGRNILDVGRNMDLKGWTGRSAYLPSNNTSVFFANRSQYHRLGGYQTERQATRQCKLCAFNYIVD